MLQPLHLRRIGQVHLHHMVHNRGEGVRPRWLWRNLRKLYEWDEDLLQRICCLQRGPCGTRVRRRDRRGIHGQDEVPDDYFVHGHLLQAESSCDPDWQGVRQHIGALYRSRRRLRDRMAYLHEERVAG